MISKSRPETGQGMGHVDTWRKSVRGRGMANAKVSGRNVSDMSGRQGGHQGWREWAEGGHSRSWGQNEWTRSEDCVLCLGVGEPNQRRRGSPPNAAGIHREGRGGPTGMPINNSLSLQLHSKGLTGFSGLDSPLHPQPRGLGGQTGGVLETPPPPQSGIRAEPAGASWN